MVIASGLGGVGDAMRSGWWGGGMGGGMGGGEWVCADGI